MADETDAVKAAEAEDVVASEVETADEAAKAPDEAPQDAPETGEEDEAPKKPRRSYQKRINELVRQKWESDAKATRLEAELAKLRQPKPEDFDDHDAYEDARDDWRDARREAKRAKQEAAQVAAAVDAEALRSFNERAEEFAKQAPDFDQVARFSPISVEVAGIITTLGDDGPAVAYALGKDHALAREVSSLTPTAAAIELGRMAASLRAPQRKVASKAPPPVRPVSGAGITQPDPDKMSPAEYRKWRLSQG